MFPSEKDGCRTEQKPKRRVSFREDDVVHIIPAGEKPMVMTNVSRLMANSSSTRNQKNNANGNHTQYGKTRHISDNSLGNQDLKSILKRASPQNILNRERVSRSLWGSANTRSSVSYADISTGQSDFNQTCSTYSTSLSNASDGIKKQSGSYGRGTDFVRNGKTQFWSSSSSSPTVPNKTTNGISVPSVGRSSYSTRVSPITSALAPEQRPILGSSIVRNFEPERLNIVGNNPLRIVSDLYQPRIEYESRNSFDVGKTVQGPTFSQYGVPARELISRGAMRFSRDGSSSNGLRSNFVTPSKNHLTQSSPTEQRVGTGLRRTSDITLFNRLRRFEKSEPYMAWQGTERSYGSPAIVQASYGSTPYESGEGNTRSSSFVFKTPHAQCYY